MFRQAKPLLLFRSPIPRFHESNDEAPASRARGRPCSENCSLWSVHQASDLLSVVLIRAGRAARCGSLRCPDIVAVSTRFVRWIDRFEWDHPWQRAWAKGEGEGTHTATRTRGRSSDWCQRISPQRPKAQTVIPSVAILTGASARAASHTRHTRARREGMASEGKAICSLQASAR